MSTPYDDAFKTLLVDHTWLMFAVVNEVFGEHYTGSERIELLPNEHSVIDDDGGERRIISDSCFGIYGDVLKKYHIECQSMQDDGTILVRMFEYDISIAIEGSEIEDGELVIRIPRSALLQLRSSRSAPDFMTVRIEAEGASLSYRVRVVKVQRYSVDEIFAKGLLFFIPFRIFAHESRFREYESDADKLGSLVDEYRSIAERLERMCGDGSLNDYTRRAILRMTAAALDGIAAGYPAVRKGVGGTLGGKVLDYEEKRIYMRGRAEGKAEGRAEGKVEGRAEGRAEGRVEGEARGKSIGRTETLGTVVRNMVNGGFSSEQISRMTGLARSEIESVCAVSIGQHILS